ncbi:40S ribosomal protein S27 [Nymphon striatum]|nr:40S ribosomal protein S27 [Nymphon striatum]
MHSTRDFSLENNNKQWSMHSGRLRLSSGSPQVGLNIKLKERNYTLPIVDIKVALNASSENLNKTHLARDILHPSPENEKRKCKLKRLVQHPNSYFMDVKCPGCYKITTVFSHAQTVVLCVGCSTVLCQPTGGRARLTEVCTRNIHIVCLLRIMELSNPENHRTRPAASF